MIYGKDFLNCKNVGKTRLVIRFWILVLIFLIPMVFIYEFNSNIFESGLDVNDQKRSVETCFNSDAIVPYLEPVLNRAKSLYENRAYLHWYERYGGSDIGSLFDDAFETMQTTIDTYSNLSM